MKFLVRWLFLTSRAVLRYLFIDIDSQDYFENKWEPSGERWTHFSYGDDDPEGFYDESTRGENMPGCLVPIYFALAIVLSPLWIPMLIWDKYRKPFLKWIGDVE